MQSEALELNKRGMLMVVDDEPVNREIMEEILESDFEVVFASSGSECLEKASALQPGVILLDVNMPSMNGYEVCKRLKEDEATRAIPVMFVSALDTLAERLAGYEAGGDDYVTKPFEPSELLIKVNVALKNRESLEKMQENASMAFNTAMTAMNSTSELGVVLHFLRESFKCDDLDALAQLVVTTMQSYDLNSTAQIRSADEVVTHSSGGTVNPLESAVIHRLYKEDRIFDMGRRSLFNYEHVSILAKNMPLDDTEKTGRFRDNIALLAEGAEARVQSIMVQVNLKRQRQGLVKMVESTRNALIRVGETHEEHKIKSIRILADLISRVEESFSFLGLSENQEQKMLQMVNQAVHDTIKVYEEGLEIDARLESVMDDLKDII